MTLVEVSTPRPSVAVITLNDPSALNAMGEKMAAEFKLRVQELAKASSGIRAVILTGAGKAFSAGGDLAMLDAKRSKTAETNRREMLGFYDSFLSLLNLNIPLIAAINGSAIGAGLCVASACDIRLAVEDAKLGFTFVRLGLHPGMGATYFLPRVIGHAAAAELMLTGRIISAQEGLRIGLISRVVPEASLMSAALEVASEIEAGGPESVGQLLRSVRQGASTLSSALEREALNQSVNYASAEFAEGIAAIREKRKPDYK